MSESNASSATWGKLIMQPPGEAEQTFELASDQVTLGRGTINDIVIADPKVSRSHARLECAAGAPTIVDLGSANGIYLNGKRVQQAALSPGDTLTLGDCRLQYAPGEAAADADLTFVDSEAALDATLASESLVMAVNDTSRPRLLLTTPETTQEFVLEDALTIGRQPGSGIVLDQERVSRQHARVERRGDGFVLSDLGSTNGTWLGERRIDEWELHDGDAFRIGSAHLLFKAPVSEEALTLGLDFTIHRTAARKPVIFVPGIMGSELWRGSERVWPNVRVLFRSPEVFSLNAAAPLEPRGVVNEVIIVPGLIKLEQYSRMGAYLVEELGYERGKDFYEFAYDWRQDVRQSARRLAEVVETWGAGRPVTILAHSLGTLVSRYYVEALGGKSRVERLVLMGGPHLGTPKAMTSLLTGPDVLPFGLMGQRLAEVMATFATSYQILPTYACIQDQDGRRVSAFEDDRWLPEAQRGLLRSAKEFRKQLGRSSSVPTVSVFGYGLKTTRQLFIHRNADGAWSNIRFDSSEEGDTSVPQSSAMLGSTDLHPVRQYHGSLFVDNDVRMRLKLILTN